MWKKEEFRSIGEASVDGWRIQVQRTVVEERGMEEFGSRRGTIVEEKWHSGSVLGLI